MHSGERDDLETLTVVAKRNPAVPLTRSESDKALLVDEVARARGVGLLMVILCIASLFWFPLLGGVDWLRYLAMTACAYFGVVCAYVWFRAKPDASYRWLFRVYSGSSAIVSWCVIYYIGVFSPAPIAATLGISFFGTCADRLFAIGCCVVASVLYSTTTLLITFHVIPDLGLIRGPETAAIQTYAIVLVPVVFVGTLAQAILSRRTASDAMKQVEDAARVVQQRDAQLAEANLDLEKALEAGAGQTGRHTGLQIGDWVLGPLIGRGAMGEVYAATHTNGGSAAAVKTLVASGDRDHLMRFRREAEIAAKLRAPGLVSVFEAGVLEGRLPFIVMELLAGHDLAWHLRKRGRLEIDEALALCEQVAHGLRAAHEAGIVHRDIKPQNLFRHEPPGGAPIWKILDFGVSKMQDSHGTLTQQRVVGTPAYMSPEQAKGHAADERSDLFSLGSVLYRSLTGQRPFRGNDMPGTMFDLVYQAPRRPGELRPDLAHDVDLFLAIALAKRPADRYASTAELANAMRDAVANRLDEQLRARAEAILAEHPWGRRIRS